MKAVIKSNIDNVVKYLDQKNKEKTKAAKMALRVESFRLAKKLKEDLKLGKYTTTPPLSVIAQFSSGKGRKRKPYQGLAKAAWCNFGQDGLISEVGFVGYRGAPLSKSWKKIAKHAQEGTLIPMTKSLKEKLLSWGISLKKGTKAKKKASLYFFGAIRNPTLRLKPRPIINKFEKDNAIQAKRNIIANFHKKLRGERI